MGEKKWYKRLGEWFFETFIIIAVFAFIKALMKTLDQHGNWFFDGDLILMFLVVFFMKRTLFRKRY